MPYRNRVTPLGEIVSVPLRGAWTGNRGILHEGTEIVRGHQHPHWLICALRFRDRRSELWRERRFTWLFFHDEAVALAAGHRPCAECRWAAYSAYRDAWAAAGLGGRDLPAGAIDRRLHAERLIGRTGRRRLHELPWAGLPDGVFVIGPGGGPARKRGDRLVPWTTDGYGAGSSAAPRGGIATVITPPASVAVLGAGYPVQIS